MSYSFLKIVAGEQRPERGMKRQSGRFSSGMKFEPCKKSKGGIK
jgi:hypothetical protein